MYALYTTSAYEIYIECTWHLWNSTENSTDGGGHERIGEKIYTPIIHTQADLQLSVGYQMRWFLPDLGCQSSLSKVIDEFSVTVHCEEMSEGDSVSPRSESKRASKWKWLHLIFSIWERLPQKTGFKEENVGERKG